MRSLKFQSLQTPLDPRNTLEVYRRKLGKDTEVVSSYQSEFLSWIIHYLGVWMSLNIHPRDFCEVSRRYLLHLTLNSFVGRGSGISFPLLHCVEEYLLECI